jgi:signal transduction histidine kinase
VVARGAIMPHSIPGKAMTPPNRWHLALMATFLLSYTAMSVFLRPGQLLTAVSDISGTTLWAIVAVVMLRAAFSHHGRTRWFWLLLAASAVMVGSNLGAWMYYEVLKHQPTPEPFWADIPIFLQPVPIMAAAAMRPGSRQRGQKFHLSTLNFLILLLWWVFIYMFLVFPNEYILLNRVIFNGYYYVLYVLEFAVLLAVFGGLALFAEGEWRKIYWHFFAASALYLISYQWLNAALERNEYYSGSIYDVPNYAAICLFLLIAVRARRVPAEKLSEDAGDEATSVSGVLAVLAVLSLPLIGLCSLFLDGAASKLRPFRVAVTLIGILLVGICVFLRQTLLARELKRLLEESKENLERLQRAQNHLMQKERLAGIGQLVAGVAHELNNPLTAVMGYSDLLIEQTSEKAPREKLEKLGSEARRIKRIIDNLLSFARPQNQGQRLLDIGLVVRESLMLCEHQMRSNKISVALEFAPNLPVLNINEGQFKQVFLSLFNNAAQALEHSEEKKIVVAGSIEDGRVVIRVTDSGRGFVDASRAFDPFYTTRPVGQGTGLGLSICYGTVKEHNGNIFVKNLVPNGAEVTIELPVVVS